MRRLLLVVAVCSSAWPAAAQAPRVTISVGAAAQPTTGAFTDVTTFASFAETATSEGLYDVSDGIVFDIGGAVRVWNGLTVGVGGTRVQRDTSSITTGSFPHPFFFNAPRTGEWTADALERTEVGIHVSAGFELLQNHPRLSLNVFGGPSFFSFKQDVVESITLIQSYPYDTIDATLETGDVDGSAVGFNVGASFGWFFSRYFGVGALIRFTQAKEKDVRIGSGDPFDLELGGFQGGGGIRVRF